MSDADLNRPPIIADPDPHRNIGSAGKNLGRGAAVSTFRGLEGDGANIQRLSRTARKRVV
jgi:hypothetical protein